MRVRRSRLGLRWKRERWGINKVGLVIEFSEVPGTHTLAMVGILRAFNGVILIFI